MTRQPNLLFIWTDQQAASTLGAYGNDRIETPNLDALADESVVFEDAYVSSPVCGPSRSTVMTGLYSHTTGVTANNIPLPSNERCFPEIGDFDDYATAWIGKWHLGDEIFPQHGFDEWVSTEDCYHYFYSDDRPDDAHSSYHDFLVENGFEPDMEDDGYRWFSREHASKLPEEYSKARFMAREASRFIEENRDRPFILHMMFLEPHPPFTSPREDQYGPEDVELPPNFEHDNFEDQTDRVRYIREVIERNVSHATRPPHDLFPPDEDDWRELISNYWGLVSLVDTHVGTVLDTLAECGLEDGTITAFTSDHGEMLASHKLFSKMVMFQEAIRVPLLLRVPGLEANGNRVERPVSQIDLVPTLLDAMDQPQPDYLQGSSWMAFLHGEGELAEDVFVEWNGANTLGIHGRASPSDPSLDRPQPAPDNAAVWEDMGIDRDLMKTMTVPIRTVITPDGWKLNYRRSGEHELYDLTEDPHETRNLAVSSEYDDVIDDLYQKILDWQKRTHDPVYL